MKDEYIYIYIYSDIDTINEHYVWYGTSKQGEANNICNQGFSKIDDKLFGTSSEFYLNNLSINAKSKINQNENHYLFLCRTFIDKTNNKIVMMDDNQKLYPQFLLKFKVTYNHNHSHINNINTSESPAQTKENRPNHIISSSEPRRSSSKAVPRHKQKPSSSKRISSPFEKKGKESKQAVDHGWVTCYDIDGQAYYKNNLTQEIQVERPPEMGLSQSNTGMSELDMLQQELPGVQLAKSNPVQSHRYNNYNPSPPRQKQFNENSSRSSYNGHSRSKSTAVKWGRHHHNENKRGTNIKTRDNNNFESDQSNAYRNNANQRHRRTMSDNQNIGQDYSKWTCKVW